MKYIVIFVLGVWFGFGIIGIFPTLKAVKDDKNKCYYCPDCGAKLEI